MNIAENLRRCCIDECEGCNIGLGSARCYAHLMLLAADHIDEMEKALNGHCWACKHGQQVREDNPLLMRCQHFASKASKTMKTKDTSCQHWEFAAGKFNMTRSYTKRL